jgi:radical SAM superfamily enzyme YgiQ (UPF0313 family)
MVQLVVRKNRIEGKMKILFISPAISVESNEIWARALKLDILDGMSFIPRLAPMVLASLTPKEYSFTYLDEDIETIDFEQIDADLIAITAMTVQADRAYFLADQFRSLGYPVVMGGIHASSCPEEAALHADTVCTGEAENYWAILLEDATSGKLKKFYHGKDYPPVEKLPSPRVDIVNHEHYSVFPLQATKGCPYSCEFCCIKLSSGNKHRRKPVKQVIAEIKELEKYNNGPFKKRYQFMDDNLYVNREYTIELLTALIPLNIQWMGMGSINISKDEEILELVAKSGCRTFYIGFESISEESLKEANKKNNSIEEYKVIAQKLIEKGIIPAGYFIFGFDNDDENSFKRTVDFAIENRIIQPLFNILTPFPGTALYERMKDKIIDKNWCHYGSVKCVYRPGKLTPRQLEIGSYGASYEVSKLNIVRDHMKYFWSHGPWEKNPRLTLRDRIILLIVASKMKKVKESKRFLIWAAFRYNATDVYQIISAAVFHSETLGYKRLRDSLMEEEKERRRLR